MLANKLLAVEGSVSGVELTMKSDTQLRRSDKALLDPPFLVSYDAFLSLFEQHPHPMWIYDLKTLRFLAVNDAAIRNYLYSREEFESMTITQADAAEASDARAIRLADASPVSSLAGIWRHRRNDGTVLEAEITSDVMMFNGRKSAPGAGIGRHPTRTNSRGPARNPGAVSRLVRPLERYPDSPLI